MKNRYTPPYSSFAIYIKEGYKSIHCTDMFSDTTFAMQLVV